MLMPENVIVVDESNTSSVPLTAATAGAPAHDWLTFRLSGRRTTDRGDASGTGYWSPREGRYQPTVDREHRP